MSRVVGMLLTVARAVFGLLVEGCSEGLGVGCSAGDSRWAVKLERILSSR